MTIFRTWMNYNYISQLPSSYAAVLFSFRLYFLALDHADLIHSADLFKVGNRLLFHRILQIKKRVRILVAALVRHIGDIDSLSSQDRRDLTDPDVPVSKFKLLEILIKNFFFSWLCLLFLIFRE